MWMSCEQVKMHESLNYWLMNSEAGLQSGEERRYVNLSEFQFVEEEVKKCLLEQMFLKIEI